MVASLSRWQLTLTIVCHTSNQHKGMRTTRQVIYVLSALSSSSLLELSPVATLVVEHGYTAVTVVVLPCGDSLVQGEICCWIALSMHMKGPKACLAYVLVSPLWPMCGLLFYAKWYFFIDNMLWYDHDRALLGIRVWYRNQHFHWATIYTPIIVA